MDHLADSIAKLSQGRKNWYIGREGIRVDDGLGGGGGECEPVRVLECMDLSISQRGNVLGVTIDFKLKFDLHVSNICKMASRQLGILKRIGKNICKLGKLNIYHSFILSNFSYCPLSWHFCGEKNTIKLEKIQERALRFIYNDYISDYDTLLFNSKKPTLKLRRLRTMALEAFKILNNQGPVYLHDLLNF